jgi:hypothetical protein
MMMRRLAPATLLMASLVALLGVACGGGDDDAPKATPTVAGVSTGGTSGGPEPILQGPASRYAVDLKDLKTAYKVDPNETYNYLLTSFAAQGPFKSQAEGEQLAKQWEILDGYKASYVPDGQLAGVLQGAYYVTAETFLFKQATGASAAYAKFVDTYKSNSGSEPQSAKQLGNESSGFKLVKGTVGNSSVVAVYHRFVFRRGNVVGVVQTYGREQTMTIAQARDIAVMMDDRALGKRDASIPTPVPTPLLAPTVGP